jgi:putative membrane protein
MDRGKTLMISHLPAFNAFLNSLSALLLATGYVMIRQKKIDAHRICMVAAFIVSSIFLVSYLTYHAKVGNVRYTGQGILRTVYFAILTSHTILAIAIVPLVLRTLYLAVKGRFLEHRQWARWTLPLWFYVSITGVVIYEMLY